MVRMSFIALLVFVQVFLFFSITQERKFLVAFLDVGQGDSIYIQAPNGRDMLIDGGATEGVLRELSSVTNVFNRDIDVVIATHPDKDHIGGLVSVFDRYNISYFLDPGVESNTLVHKELKKEFSKKRSALLLEKESLFI